MFKVVATMATGEVRVVAEGDVSYQKMWEVAKSYVTAHGLKVKSIKVVKDEGAEDEQSGEKEVKETK